MADLSVILDFCRLIISLLLIVLFACLEKRKSVRPDLLYGRPSVPIPVRFLDGYKDRKMYCAASCSLGYLAMDLLTLTGRVDAIPAVKAFVLLFGMFFVAAVYAPLLLSITTRHTLIGSIVGLCYTLGSFGVHMMEAIENDFGYSPAFILFYFLPAFVCDVLLFLLFIKRLYTNIKTKQFTTKFTDVVSTHQVRYVEFLFKNYKIDYGTSFGRLHWLIYKCRPDFKYPINIVFASTIATTIVYLVFLWFIYLPSYFQELIRRYIDIVQSSNHTFRAVELQFSSLFLDDNPLFLIFKYDWYVASVIGLLVASFHIYMLLLRYRKNILKLYKGENSQLINEFRKSSPIEVVAWSLKFKGYLIAYTLWGYLICTVVVWLILSIIIGGCYVLNEIDLLADAIETVAQYLILPVITWVLFLLQKLLTRFFFLQPKINPDDQYRPLNIDNRRCFEFLGYYWIFNNLIVGFISSILRIIKSFSISLFMIGCLERPLLLRGFEQYDRGFFSYVSMLYLDVAHNHPILRVFISHIWGPKIEEKQTGTINP
ncbi:stimulated by retinoic acid gene 6 protein-like [Patella vulgata]|uniref:stimulated by retinoic acid gene 6 protein-like n=1 Tax=Patella vulgata TaxID=6465 RepID=UPI0024A8C0E8|nr:stimulated by retinoic acid gene 6 protein-like [Patella vulgata]